MKKIQIYLALLASAVARDKTESLSAHAPLFAKLLEVNRQDSTSSALSFLRWVGDESLRDDRKKKANCVAPQLPFLSLWHPKRSIY